MSSGEQSVLLSKYFHFWVRGGGDTTARRQALLTGKRRGGSIFSTCLAAPLSSALTAQHVSDVGKGALSSSAMADIREQPGVSTHFERVETPQQRGGA